MTGKDISVSREPLKRQVTVEVEIEITPEMVSAGVDALCGRWGHIFDEHEAELLVHDIISAALAEVS